MHDPTLARADLALQRLRKIGLGIIAASVVLDALSEPYVRWRLFKTRMATRLDPLERSEGMLVAVVADLLAATDALISRD